MERVLPEAAPAAGSGLGGPSPGPWQQPASPGRQDPRWVEHWQGWGICLVQGYRYSPVGPRGMRGAITGMRVRLA